MRREVHAEWTKLRTAGGVIWLPVALVVSTVAVSVLAGAAVTCPHGRCGHDPLRTALFGVQAGQALVAVLAVVVIGGEYGTGMIRTTLMAMPRRTAVLAAKATVLTGLTLAGGTVAVLAALAAGWLALPGGGPLPPGDGPTLRAAVGSICYLWLVALLGLGVATAVRDATVAAGAVLGLLYLFPAVIAVVFDPDWQRRLWRISPANAGLAVQHTDPSALPLGPWAGLGVLAAWSAAALLTGGLLLRLRDA